MNRRIRFQAAGSLCLLLIFVCVAASQAASIWREGERADEARVQRYSWYDGVQQEMLSGGEWLSNFGQEEGRATYQLEIPENGRYRLWVRANPTASRLSWSLDDGDWREAPMQHAQHRRNVADGGAVDLRFVAWVDLGDLKLEAGRHTLRFRLHSENNNHGAIDAIYLTTEGRQPVGKGDPAEAAKQHAEGYFPWAPGADPLTGESPIDLRYLNEESAGANGFIRREEDHFVLGNGRPARFWMVQGGLGDQRERYERRARRLAKYGVNVVRMGGGSFFEDWRRGNRDAFERRLDRFHAKVAALKKAGIYTYIDHLYWHTHTEITEEIYPGFGDGKPAIALMFFSEKFQDLYQEFLRDLMTANNPETGKPMASDPAVGFVEIQNESSLLFWTFKPGEFPETERHLVERKFGDWLKRKYGSLAKAEEAWGDNPRAGNPTADNFDEGRAGLYDIGMLTGQAWAVNQRNPKRAGDQLRFLVEAQKRFYREMKQALHQEAGLNQVIVPSNWKTADARVLDGLERYTYTGADVICRNSYFGVDYPEGGQQRFYEIEVGDTYRYHSALKAPGYPAPLATPQIAGYPFMVTENNWTRPNRYRVEWPLMVAAYAPMMGIESGNEYGAVLAVALDDRPIAESDRVLVQTGTWDRPYGFETEPAGDYERITDLGGFPLNVRRIEGTVAMRSSVEEAVVLDGNGYPTERRVRMKREGQHVVLKLPHDSLYTLVK